MSRGSYLICWTVALLVAASPLPFGSVDPVPVAALEICLLATAAAWMVCRWRARQTPLPWKDPLLLAGAVLLGYGLLQIIPLPISVVEILSPASAAMKKAYSPVTPAWTALSLYPYATWRSCIGIVCWCLTALMVRHNALDLKGRLVAAGGLVAGGLFQAGYGLFEFISGRQHIFGFQKKYFTDVATGTFISRNNYAGYLEMAIPVALALAMLCLDRAGPAAGLSAPVRRRLAAASGKESFRALLLLMGAFLMGTALLMSRSRAGIISVAFSLVVGGLALGLQGRSRRFALCSVVVAGLVVIFASQIDILPVVQRFQSLGDEFGSGYGRLQVWKQAVPMLSAYPLFGSGMGTWEMAFSPFRTDGTQVKVDFAHNDYLEFAAEAGLIGFALFGLGVALLLRCRARAGARADEIGLAAGLGLAALALHSLTDFHLSIPADALTASVLAGLFLREGGPAAPEGVRAGRAHRHPAAGRAGWSRAAVGAACLACLLALALAAASPAAAQMSSQPAPKHDDIMDSETLAMSAPSLDPSEELCPACRLEPFNAGRYIEATSRARQRLLQDVEALLQVQASGDLPDLASKQYLARRIDQAIGLVQQGLALAPTSGRGHMEVGLLRFGRFVLIGLPPQASDDFEKARGEFGKALELQPWRAASFGRVARLMAPLWDECDEEQREFIARAARRAVEIDPGARDIKDAMERMGV